MTARTDAPAFVPAARVGRIRVSPTVAAAARARELKAEGRDIVDMTAGEPDFDTPEPVRAAAVAAIAAGQTRYTATNGTPELRAAIRADFGRRLGLDYADGEITVGGGGKPVIFVALMASLDAGDEVIVPAPYWVSYPDMVLANDGTPVIVACPESDGFKLTPERLEAAITPRTRWLMLNSPSNPTGAAYGRGELEALGAVLLRHPGVWVLSDDIYDQVWFSPEPMTTLAAAVPALKDRTLLVNGVSKAYAMTGWRLGYGAGPAPLVAAINKLQSQISSCPSSVSQAAAVAALSGNQGFVAAACAAYRERRDYAVDRLSRVPGLTCRVPDGAFYLYPGCPGAIGKRTPDGTRIESDEDFVRYLLDSVGVAAVHGAAYGLSPYFRLSIATSLATIEQGCDRIEAAMRALV